MAALDSSSFLGLSGREGSMGLAFYSPGHEEAGHASTFTGDVRHGELAMVVTGGEGAEHTGPQSARERRTHGGVWAYQQDRGVSESPSIARAEWLASGPGLTGAARGGGGDGPRAW